LLEAPARRPEGDERWPAIVGPRDDPSPRAFIATSNSGDLTRLGSGRPRPKRAPFAAAVRTAAFRPSSSCSS
jgi:hypothetical protein